MKCILDYDKILAYRLGELAGREAEEIGRHIASCPRCAREFKATEGILKGLTELQRMEPDPARWVDLRNTIEHERRPRVVRLISVLAYNLRRPAVATGALLLVCAIGGYLFVRRESVPERREIAVEELGSTIARTRPGKHGLGDALDSYINDSRALVAVAVRCAESKSVGCWNDLKAGIVEKDMLYRGIWLSEQLSRPSAVSNAKNVEERNLIDDSLGILRAISEQAPESLSSTENALEKEITRMDLLNRLTEGRGR